MSHAFEELKGHVEGIVMSTKNYAQNVLLAKLPSTQNDFDRYYLYVKSITTDDIIRDFSEFRVSPITVTATATALTTIIVLTKLLGSSNSLKQSSKHKSSKKKKGKKVSKAVRSNREIEAVLDHVATEYGDAIDAYINNYSLLKPEDIEYKYNYYEEMLLKELFKLDAIDVMGNEVLKGNRKKVVNFIQDYQKRLDTFKKEVGF